MQIKSWIKEKKNMNWVSQAFIAMVSVSIMMIIMKRLTQFQLKPEVINFYFFLFTTIFFLILILMKKTSLNLPTRSIPFFLIIGLIAIAYNYFSVSALGSAPNPGYVEAINSFRVVIIIIASYLIYDSSISLTKIIGIILCTGGLIIISL